MNKESFKDIEEAIVVLGKYIVDSNLELQKKYIELELKRTGQEEEKSKMTQTTIRIITLMLGIFLIGLTIFASLWVYGYNTTPPIKNYVVGNDGTTAVEGEVKINESE